MNLKRTFKKVAKATLRTLFERAQAVGFDLLPRHFYSEIPDIRRLRRTAHWRAPFSMTGVEGAEIEDQVRFMRGLGPPEIGGIDEGELYLRACEANGEIGYGPVEAAVLYRFIRVMRPRQICQIGCGVSTAICLMAARASGYSPEITCIDPYPTSYLKRLAREEAVTLLKAKVETLDSGWLDRFGDDMLLFIDSTHTLGPAGEVSRIILEMLPRLKRGAWVHFHDITFPYDYDRNLLRDALVFPHESALLHAFLIHNSRFALQASLSMLHYAAAAELAEMIHIYRPAPDNHGLSAGPGHFPSASYLRVVA